MRQVIQWNSSKLDIIGTKQIVLFSSLILIGAQMCANKSCPVKVLKGFLIKRFHACNIWGLFIRKVYAAVTPYHTIRIFLGPEHKPSARLIVWVCA